MKHYKLAAWPDLPEPFQRMAYQRMLHRISNRHASVAQLVRESGLGRGAVVEFLDTLAEQQLLDAREANAPPLRLRQLGWLSWWRRPPPDAEVAPSHEPV